MAKPGDVIDVPELGVRVEFRATARVDRRRVHRGRRRRRARRASSRVAHVHVGVTEHHTVIEGSMRVKLHGKMHVLGPGDEITIPPDTPHSRSPGARAGPDPHPPDAERPQRRVLRAPRRARLQPLRLPQARSGAKFVRELGEAGHAARPSLKTQQRLAALLDSEYTFVDEWDVAAAARGRLRRARRRHDLPAVVEAGLHRRRATTASTPTSTSRAACPTTCTRARARRTPSARTGSRARPTATCAAPASGR